MVTLRIPPRGRRATRGVAPVHAAVRDLETILYDLPVMRRFTNRDSFGRKIMRRWRTDQSPSGQLCSQWRQVRRLSR